MTRRVMFALVALLLLAGPILAACGATATPTAIVVPPTIAAKATTPPTAVPPTSAPPTATTVPPTATPQGPTPGGKLVVAYGAEPPTLDPHKHGNLVAAYIGGWMNAALIDRDPKTGQYIPFLAESWKISEDGLTWDFVIRKGVKFHDGSPCTAKDFVWTYTRAKDPATKSPAAATMLASVASVEAPDDYTLRLKMKAPSFPMMYNLTLKYYLTPLKQALVEAGGDQYGRNHVSVGAYKLKEWVTGDRIVLERNPDFNWGPSYAHQGPRYFDQVEFRFIPEYSTIEAGIESGEIDVAGIQAKDLQRVKDTGKAQVFELLFAGCNFLAMNVSKPPFDDVNVRQAFNMAVDRETVIKVALQGQGLLQNGYVSAGQAGYWAGVEKLGYPYDPARAKALMKDAGYIVGAGSILEKAGQPLKLAIKCSSAGETATKVAQLAQENLKALGVDATIEQTEPLLHSKNLIGGNYQIAVMSQSYPEADLLFYGFHSSMIGAINPSQVKDPTLDKILEATRSTMDPTKRQQYVNDAETRIVEQAYILPLYTSKDFTAVSKRIKGVYVSALTSFIYFDDAYIGK